MLAGSTGKATPFPTPLHTHTIQSWRQLCAQWIKWMRLNVLHIRCKGLVKACQNSPLPTHSSSLSPDMKPQVRFLHFYACFVHLLASTVILPLRNEPLQEIRHSILHSVYLFLQWGSAERERYTIDVKYRGFIWKPRDLNRVRNHQRRKVCKTDEIWGQKSETPPLGSSQWKSWWKSFHITHGILLQWKLSLS